MIPPEEYKFPLAHSPEYVPRLRRGRKIHKSTCWRWATRGVRGVVLETVQVGGTRCTSREALQRFFERLTLVSRGEEPSRVQRTVSQRQRQSEAAAQKLDELGV
jgi:hypothetical protein